MDDSAVTVLDNGDTESDTFSNAIDNDLATDTEMLTITILGLNDAPIISGLIAQSATEDTPTITDNNFNRHGSIIKRKLYN